MDPPLEQIVVMFRADAWTVVGYHHQQFSKGAGRNDRWDCGVLRGCGDRVCESV